MSHIHLPDGVLPVWLWASGFVLVILIWTVLFRLIKKEELTRRIPLLGMMAAVMVLSASVHIFAYHVNLTVMSGILLGPSLIFLATFVVNVILALFGHGGITVIGLNTLMFSIEGILGYFLFHLFWRLFGRLSLAVFLATFLALFVSTFSMIGVVSLGTSHYEELIHQESGKGIVGFEFGNDKENHQEKALPEQEVNLKRFMAIILPVGFIGWVLEGIIMAFIARYIHLLRPDLLKLDKESR